MNLRTIIGSPGKSLGKILATIVALSLTSIAVAQDKPNILIIWGDDIGQFNISAYNMGMMGYKTPNIDSIANEGAVFTDWYGQQSCTAGRAAFITGQSPMRTGLTKVGLPGAPEGMKIEDPTIAVLLKAQGYATGQFGKNHLGDRDEMLPTNHGFDEFFGNLYHLNAEEEPELPDYPRDMVLADGTTFAEKFGPRGVIHSYADGRIEDTGPLTKKRMETVDEEVTTAAMGFMEQAVEDDCIAVEEKESRRSVVENVASLKVDRGITSAHCPGHAVPDHRALNGQVAIAAKDGAAVGCPNTVVIEQAVDDLHLGSLDEDVPTHALFAT